MSVLGNKTLKHVVGQAITAKRPKRANLFSPKIRCAANARPVGQAANARSIGGRK